MEGLGAYLLHFEDERVDVLALLGESTAVADLFFGT
jgi:hypothetical protein